MCCEQHSIRDLVMEPLSEEAKQAISSRRAALEYAFRRDAARMARLRAKEAEAVYYQMQAEAYKRWSWSMQVATEGRFPTVVVADWVGQDTLPNLVIEQPSKETAPAQVAKDLVLR